MVLKASLVDDVMSGRIRARTDSATDGAANITVKTKVIIKFRIKGDLLLMSSTL
jgi:hypothetical protein